jgi:hypothetical protein
MDSWALGWKSAQATVEGAGDKDSALPKAYNPE